MECSHKTYNIYCDESTHLENDGQPYMIYGYVSIPYNEMALAKKADTGNQAKARI